MSTLPVLQQFDDDGDGNFRDPESMPTPDGNPEKDFFVRLQEHHGISVDLADQRSPLGEGGFSFVFRGHSESLGRNVAVKKAKMPFDAGSKWCRQELRAIGDLLEKEDLGSMPNILTLLMQPLIVEDRESRMYLTTVRVSGWSRSVNSQTPQAS